MKFQDAIIYSESVSITFVFEPHEDEDAPAEVKGSTCEYADKREEAADLRTSSASWTYARSMVF